MERGLQPNAFKDGTDESECKRDGECTRGPVSGRNLKTHGVMVGEGAGHDTRGRVCSPRNDLSFAQSLKPLD